MNMLVAWKRIGGHSKFGIKLWPQVENEDELKKLEDKRYRRQC